MAWRKSTFKTKRKKHGQNNMHEGKENFANQTQDRKGISGPGYLVSKNQTHKERSSQLAIQGGGY